MMAKTSKKLFYISDIAIITKIGNYIKHWRLLQNKTQGNIAKEAGVHRWTVSKIENGDPISLLSLIQILRALNLLDVLSIFEVNTQPSPIALAKIDKEKRQRASKQKKTLPKKNSEW